MLWLTVNRCTLSASLRPFVETILAFENMIGWLFPPLYFVNKAHAFWIQSDDIQFIYSSIENMMDLKWVMDDNVFWRSSSDTYWTDWAYQVAVGSCRMKDINLLLWNLLA